MLTKCPPNAHIQPHPMTSLGNEFYNLLNELPPGKVVLSSYIKQWCLYYVSLNFGRPEYKTMTVIDCLS